MTKRLIIVVLLLALLFGGIFGWKFFVGQKMAAMMSAPPPPATIASASVEAMVWTPYLQAVGSIVATDRVRITTEVAGQVQEILFEDAQHVDAGDVILQLDDSVDRADLDGLVAQRKLARLQYDRASKLLKDKSVSRSDYDQTRAQLDIADAALAAKRANIKKKEIRAPFSGQLGISDTTQGEFLAPGTGIVSLEALDPIYVDYNLPERHFDKVSVGQKVLVEVQAFPDRLFEGEITAINPGIDPGTRSVRLRATLPNPEYRLRHGMFAEVRTELPARVDVLTLPRSAITYNPYGESVFVIVEKDGAQVVERRNIKTGEVREGRVEVVSGLQAGEQVVSAGHNKLRNGQAVTVDNSVQLDAEVSGG